MKRKDPVTLTQKEQQRLRVVSAIQTGAWSVAETAQALGLSERQVRRLRKRYKEEGGAAFMHGNRGRPSAHRMEEDLRSQVVALGRGPSAACNDSHLRELLILREGIARSRASVQRIRRQARQKPMQNRRDRLPPEVAQRHFAALDTASGKVIGSCRQQHRSMESIKFLNQIDAAVPQDLDIHLILDNYATHKTPSVHRWPAKRPRYQLHFTPTSASWLNLVER